MARKHSATTRSKTSARETRRPSKSAPSRRGSSAKVITDHEQIRNWAEERGGSPACVKGTGSSKDVGMIRIEFPNAPNANDQNLEEIDWDEFFQKFDENQLGLVIQDSRSGGASNFYKVVKRSTARNRGSSGRGSSSSRRRSTAHS
jgi:hypothetical protein